MIDPADAGDTYLAEQNRLYLVPCAVEICFASGMSGHSSLDCSSGFAFAISGCDPQVAPTAATFA